MRSFAARGVALLLVAVSVQGCGQGEPAHGKGTAHADAELRARAPTPVRAREVAKASADGSAKYSATIEPATRVDLAFRIGGYLESLGEVNVDGASRRLEEGDWVKKGTVLAQVRAADYAQKVATASAAIAEAMAAKKLAEQDFERTSKLVANQSTSKADLDVKTARLEAAKAQIDGAKARAGEAAIALQDTALKAPMDGVVLKRRVEVGTLVGPGTVAFVLADTRSVKVIFGAPEALVEKLQVGSPLVITSESIQGDITGKVTRIAPSADLQGRLFSVESTIPNPDDALKTGMVVSLKVPEGVLADESLVLPLTAVVRSPRDPRGFSVFVLEAQGERQIAKLRDVECGDVRGNTIVITKGLTLGERVVSMGATLLRDGDEASVIP